MSASVGGRNSIAGESIPTAFDYRPLVALDPEEAQLREGGLNLWDNCVPATFALMFRWLGYGDPFEPEQITEAVYWPGYRGVEDITRVAAFFRHHPQEYPGCPDIVQDSGDIIALADAAGANGFPTAALWYCDTAGTILTRNTGDLHYSPIVFDDGASLGIWNVMRGELITLSHTQASSAFAGGFVAIRRSLITTKSPQEDTMRALTVFDLAPGQVKWIGGPDQGTNWNAVAASDQSTTLTVITYRLDGTPISSKQGSLSGNQPNVKGPSQFFGTASDLGASGPCTLGFVNDGGGPCTVTIHW